LEERNTGFHFSKLLKKLVNWAKREEIKLILLLDNGPVHTAKFIKEYLECVNKYIEVYWLPKYSPELNPIELLWKKLKEAGISNLLYESEEEFKAEIEKKLKDIKNNRNSFLRIRFKERIYNNGRNKVQNNPQNLLQAA